MSLFYRVAPRHSPSLRQANSLAPARLRRVLAPLSRCTTLLLVAAASGGVVVMPAVAAGGGSICMDYNPALYTKGNTYTVISKFTFTVGAPYTEKTKYKVMGPTTFRGHKVIDIREKTFQHKKLIIINYFYTNGHKYRYLYGFRGHGVEEYNDPPIPLPKCFVKNVPYAEAFTTNYIPSGVVPSVSVRRTITFLGKGSITVPAGKFMADKLRMDANYKAHGTMPYGLHSWAVGIYSWVVASGRYAGLVIKNTMVKTATSSPSAVKMKKIALSLRLNGK